MSTAIQAEGLGKRLGSSWVLKGISLKIGQGESVALLGPNGSGKSTLLKLISGLMTPSRGEIRVLGSVLPGGRFRIRPRLRYLTHESPLYPLLTVTENLRLAAGILGLPSGLLPGHLERFRLEGYRDKRVSELSEGFKRRVMLARLALGEERAEIVLLDEPYPSLDQEGRRFLEDLVKRWRGEGKTLIMASHEPGAIFHSLDREILLKEGGIESDRRIT